MNALNHAYKAIHAIKKNTAQAPRSLCEMSLYTGVCLTKMEWNVHRVRKTFIDFFVQKYNHTFIPSSSTIPHEDPTLLFANSGMTQVRKEF